MDVRCSICIATYNGSKYIHSQIKSIIVQLAPDDEIIVSDDNSTDNTLELIRKFNDERIKIYINDRKRGPVGNFENALEKAKGLYIFLADQDDKWLPGKLERHLLLHQKYDLVISDAYVVDEEDNIIYESFFKQRGSKAGLIKNLVRNSYIGCCMSINRKMLRYAMPFPSQIYMHDWWIGLVAEARGKVIFTSDKLIHYLRHGNNASPTLGNSGYSAFKRFRNRAGLILGLVLILFKTST